MQSPAPISSTRAIAISATTRPPLRRCWDAPPWDERPPSLSTPCKFWREACKAGSNPKTSPVASESTRVKASETPSKGKLSCMFGASSFGMKSPTESTAQPAISVPAHPPRSASSMLSVRNRRMSCQRFAPAACRIATSFCRVAALASIRFPTFAATISCTPRLTTNRSRRAGPMITCAPQGHFESGTTWWWASRLLPG